MKEKLKKKFLVIYDHGAESENVYSFSAEEETLEGAIATTKGIYGEEIRILSVILCNDNFYSNCIDQELWHRDYTIECNLRNSIRNAIVSYVEKEIK